MANYPDFITLNAFLCANNIGEAIQITIMALEEINLLPILGLAVPSDEALSINIDEKLNTLNSISDADGIPSDAQFDFGNGSSAILYKDPDHEWTLSATSKLNEPYEITVINAIHGLVKLCRNLLSAKQISRAYLSRIGIGLECVPVVPIANTFHLVVTTESEVQAAYKHPEVFWQAGWDSVEAFGDLFLLVRGLNAADSVVYLSQIISRQWDMARASKPQKTQYYAPRPAREEVPIFSSGDPYLVPAGYIAPINTVEYAAYVPSGEHIRGWEIFDLRSLIRQGSLPDGRKVDVVRIVFYTREMAEQEKRPLLDIGAQVFFQASPDIIQITE